MFGHTPILTIAESREWESRLLVDEQLERDALHAAGHALGRAILRDFTEITDWPDDPRILLLGGKGHNTGDALLAIGDLMEVLPRAQVTLLWEGERSIRPLVREIWRSLQTRQGIRIRVVLLSENREYLTSLLSLPWTMTLDAIFGMGFRPPLPKIWKDLFPILGHNTQITVRASVDLPSGLEETASPGEVLEADFTYAMGIPKAPLFLPGRRNLTGRIRYLDIGLLDHALPADWPPRECLITPSILRQLKVPRSAAADKRHFGHVGILGGSLQYPGAPLLATLAAISGGAGLVTSAVPESMVGHLASAVPESIWLGLPTTPEGTLSLESIRDIQAASRRWDTMVIGPGLGRSEETYALLGDLIQQFPGPMILDADALHPGLPSQLTKRSEEHESVILLPHAGEWQRLAGADLAVPEIQQWARDHRAILVRKGALTRITDGKPQWVSSRGGPILARGGSGDILAGLTGALVGRFHREIPLRQLAAMAVCWQGMAAEASARQQGENPVRTSSLTDFLAPVLRDSSI